MSFSDLSDLQAELAAQCEIGQRQLMSMEYLAAEKTLAGAEEKAWEARAFDTLARMLLPLQEARRQRRQCAGDGVVCLDYIADGPGARLDPEKIVAEIPRGQLLVAGYQSIAPALKIRQIQAERGLYLDTFLAAAQPSDNGLKIVIVPFVDSEPSLQLSNNLILSPAELPHGPLVATAETYGRVMDLWERLHAPFLAFADAQTDPIAKIAAYRRTIDVDYACEFAHQRMAEVVRQLI